MKLRNNPSLQRVVDLMAGSLVGHFLYDFFKIGDALHVGFAVALVAAAMLVWYLLKRPWLEFAVLFIGTFLGVVLYNIL